jgi:hypothetical protein
MTIDFEFTKEDLIDFNYSCLRIEKPNKKYERLGYFLLSVFLIIIGMISYQFVIFGLGIALLGYTIYGYIELKKSIVKAVHQLEKQGNLDSSIGFKKLEICDLGLKLTDKFGENLYSWEHINEIKKIDRFLCINCAEISLPIPGNVDNLTLFIIELKERIK